MINRKLVLTLGALIATTGLVACKPEPGAGEKAGKAIDQAAEQAAKKAEEASKAVGQAADKAAEKAGQAVDAAGKATTEAANTATQKVEEAGKATAAVAAAAMQSVAQPAAIDKLGCLNCHALDSKKVGPSFKDIAAKFKSNPGAAKELLSKLMSGSGHPAIKGSEAEVSSAVGWVLTQ